MLQKAIQNEIIRRICRVTKPVKILLFGSYAYGTPTEHSDLDIAVICERVASKAKESVRIRRALHGILYSKDIIVTTPEEFDFYSTEPGSVFRTIAEKGIVLYAG
jgi:uncharacterized protein